MKISAIKKELDELRDKVFNLKHGGVSNDPEVVKARKAYHKILNKVEDRAKKKCKPLEKKIEVLRLQYQGAVEASKVQIPEQVKKEWKMMCCGIDYGRPFEMVWVSPKKKFYIMKRPGHQTWAGLGATRYAPTEHILMKTGVEVCSGMSGLDLYNESSIFEHNGRLGKTKKQEWMKYAVISEEQ